ncbi:sulfotransferase 1C2-like isoform X2 [Stegostoma tigrinum]|uniref:sulfotransferase 1C2-like isoform X2 n=1 Tax=Stegostoma tigrinum TaxID=3053191 RepID=UPI0028708A8D|nr:sulfotransferase 1C2-like isoform X2 [Stegostoma tigrinum]
MSSAQDPAGGGGEQQIERPSLVSLHGVAMSEVFIENWAAVESYQADPRDLLVVTYPKAGTTWVQEIVDAILHEGDHAKCGRAPIHKRIPYLEFSFRGLLPSVTYGLWHDHVKGWWQVKDEHPILYIFYEDIKEDPRREIVKIMKFLGKELPDAVLDGIVQQTSFESMKENPMTNYSTVSDRYFDRSISLFMRKGTVGDWKNHFTVAQDEVFEEDYRRKMGDTDLRFRTELRGSQ